MKEYAALAIVPSAPSMPEVEDGRSERLERLSAAIRTYSLTRRQAQVLFELSSGQANKEIANALGCAEVTVESHMTQLLRKVGVGSRAQLISRFWSSF